MSLCHYEPSDTAVLLAGLNLVVSRDNISIAGRNALVLVRAPDTSILVLLSTITLLLSLRTGLTLRLALHDVHNAARLPLAVGKALVLVVVLVGELGDDVPCVEQAGDESKDAKEDVDDGVGGADAALDPDCDCR